MSKELFDFDEVMRPLPQYKIVGASYHLKDTLVSWGCHWDKANGHWATMELSEDDYVYKGLKRLCADNGLQLEKIVP